jgi:hypothetical protein
MGGETVLSYKPQLLSADDGVIRKFHPTTDGNSFIESVQQDVSGHLEATKWRREQTSGQRHKGFGTMIASYPISMWEEWVRKGIVNTAGKVLDDAAFSREVLNNPDLSAFRTKEGRY